MPYGDPRLSRRDFLNATVAAPFLTGVVSSSVAPAASEISGDTPRQQRSPILTLDHRSILGRADLVYDRAAPRSEEGLPIGNGRMGSLIWTSSGALHLQINRVDVYGNDSTTNSFVERHSDYCGGCGFVDVHVGTRGDTVFPERLSQRLSVRTGLATIEGTGVTARVLAWPQRDVFAISLDDRRATPEPVRVALRMLRYAGEYVGDTFERNATEHIVAVRTRSHVAESQLHLRGDRIVLTQTFREGSYFNRSAVAIRVVGRDAKASIANPAELQIVAAGGSTLILIASAASFDPAADVIAGALEDLDRAETAGMTALTRETATWWERFWSRGFVHLSSRDGVAEDVERHYHYFLYLMGATSRGAFPTKFNGMLWNTGGDVRAWGGQHWFANLSCYYEALFATNRLELLDPMWTMYSGMFDASAIAARQQWGSQGIFIPETTFFNGLAPLPADIAAEMPSLYLVRKPWTERSIRFREFASTKHPHSSRWNWMGGGSWVDGKWVITERGQGPYGPVSHILGTTPKIAYWYWRRYEYTQDRAWLRDRAYPMLRGAAEFYRHFPNLRREADGRFHLYGANSNESVWGGTDTDEDMSALRGLLPAAIRAAELLGVDSDLRRAWRELLERAAPIPTSDLSNAIRPASYRGPRVFVRSVEPAVQGGSFMPDRNSLPMWFFDLCAVETSDVRLRETAAATFDAFFPNGISADTPVSVLSKVAIAAAALGRADAVRHLVPSQIRSLRRERVGAYQDGGVLANRMMLREGHQALDAQRLGRAAEALHQALLQSIPPTPGGEPILRVFPACPTEWDAAFTLLARGAFLVTASRRAGQVEFVELVSQAGGPCRLRNPWDPAEVQLFRDGRAAERLRGSLLRFATRRDERIVVVRAGETPERYRRTLT